MQGPSATYTEVRWPPSSVGPLKQSLTELVELVQEVSRRRDSELEARWLARLLVVRSCGYLEQVVDEVSRGLMMAGHGEVVRTFSLSWIPKKSNPLPDRLIDWVARFDVSWSNELRDLLLADDEVLSRELSLLVDRRNKIAHGLSEGITVRKALDLESIATLIADWFIERFDPNP